MSANSICPKQLNFDKMFPALFTSQLNTSTEENDFAFSTFCCFSLASNHFISLNLQEKGNSMCTIIISLKKKRVRQVLSAITDEPSGSISPCSYNYKDTRLLISDTYHNKSDCKLLLHLPDYYYIPCG